MMKNRIRTLIRTRNFIEPDDMVIEDDDEEETFQVQKTLSCTELFRSWGVCSLGERQVAGIAESSP